MAKDDEARSSLPAPTLANVAELAGVSQITVSRILRGKGPVAPKTRERVMEAVRVAGYVPNRVAGSLASAGSNLIGVVIPSLSNVVFPEVLRGVNEALAASEFQSVVAVTDYDMDREEELVRAVLAWKPAAMIIAGFDHTPETRRMLMNCGVRVAELMDIDSTPVDIAVGLSHRKAGHATGVHLLQRGYRRFGYVGHDWAADRRARIRYEGLATALREAGVSIAAEAVAEVPSSVFVGRRGLDDLLARIADIDVAVFSNDDMAVGGIFHCFDRGIVPKRDLGIFGFNGLEIGQALPLPLSTIRSDRYRIGHVAVERIFSSNRRSPEPEITDLGFEIIAGETA